MEHPALGRLRGQTAPSAAVLDRLLGIKPTFRVSWAPPSQQRPGLWEIYEYSPNPLRAEAGWYFEQRLARIYRRADQLPAAERAKLDLGLWRNAQAMIDQVHFVAAYTHEQFGTDFMFRDLAEGEALLKDKVRELDSAMRADEQRQVLAEIAVNPELNDRVMALVHDDSDETRQLRDWAKEIYPKVALAQVNQGWTPAREATPTGG